MNRTPRYPLPRRGVTLIELLVVISVMLLLMVMAIPMVRLMVARRPVREAARAVSDYFAAAQVRARETGRPAGVWIQRFGNQPQSAFTLYQAEVPPPYGGDTISSTGALTLSYGTATDAFFDAAMANGFNQNLVSPGDRFQLNYQGPWYEVTIVNPSLLTLRLDIRDGTTVPWMTTPSAPLPYQILRQPMRTAAKPLQLPGTTVIDLYESGTSTVAFEPLVSSSDPNPVIVMFAPNGGLDGIRYQDATIPPTEPVHLLIGRRDRLPAIAPPLNGPPGPTLAEDVLRNWQDLNNLWVTVFPRNGLVTVSENAAVTGAVDYSNRNDRLAAFVQAREYAAQGQSLGGR
jgi:prepilin-type N-terminal cleavage/methylation domain-containing protein